MYVTEDHAKSKMLCPFAFTLEPGDMHCIGSMCMLWRQDTPQYSSCASDSLKATSFPAVGYCGPAGVPK